MAPIVIRNASEHDMEALFAIDRLTWSSLSSPGIPSATYAEYRKYHTPENRLVAVRGDQVCGHLHLHPPTPLQSNSHVAEFDIAVHPDCQSQGVGSLLLQAAEKWALQRGKRKLSLRVLSSNPAAIRFYQRNGFVEEGRLRQEFFLNGTYVDDLLMAKLLVQAEH